MPDVSTVSDGVAIRGRGLVLSWDGRTALASSDFEIAAESITAVIGPNGSGKSTLLHAIAGLLDPVAGELSVTTQRPLSEGIAYVLQSTKVNETMPVTVREVVLMGRYAHLGMFGSVSSEDRDRCSAALERLRIGNLENRHLDELSGGQRQRVFVAQGLVQEADILLLDEPITGLDLVSKEIIKEVILEERDRGTSIVMTTHDLADAGAADHVLLLSGVVLASGLPDEVLTPHWLSEAYGIPLTTLESGAVVLDDPYHRAAGTRHVHFDRTGPRQHHP